MKLLFTLKLLNETRLVLLFSMNKFCSILVCMEINLKLLPDLLALLKTSNLYFEMSDGSLSSKQRFYFMENESLFHIYFSRNKTVIFQST